MQPRSVIGSRFDEPWFGDERHPAEFENPKDTSTPFNMSNNVQDQDHLL